MTYSFLYLITNRLFRSLVALNKVLCFSHQMSPTTQ